MLTHVVLMKFTDPADAAEAKELLEGLVPGVPQIQKLTVGVDVVRAAVSWDLVLLTEHADLEGLKGYQEHPSHLEVAGWLRPRLASRATVDF
ncbi:stress responsive alpha/beta barrel protein [Actinocorallia herbida]|uniref:Stress responsive alpha/beta barrel protein n=1 Tax=Actinocorallia herbida TaxID=58109 RepID=A0A3N1D4R6_9ACTN|nr:Dabb family protein [Actinocorallia herbida]ROO88531.1 stress responsive alpha/beta barrel protein [Actinocorallia herbida]